MTSLVLIGPPGSGKSTVARLLSEELAMPWLDTDAMVVERSGKAISEIFVDEGEPAFRALEKTAVLDALSRDESIISLGGGSVADREVSELLATGAFFVIYLKVGIASAAERIGFNRDRPLLLVNPRQQWLSLLAKRSAIYESLADLIVDNDSDSPALATKEIASVWSDRKAEA